MNPSLVLKPLNVFTKAHQLCFTRKLLLLTSFWCHKQPVTPQWPDEVVIYHLSLKKALCPTNLMSWSPACLSAFSISRSSPEAKRLACHSPMEDNQSLTRWSLSNAGLVCLLACCTFHPRRVSFHEQDIWLTFRQSPFPHTRVLLGQERALRAETLPSVCPSIHLSAADFSDSEAFFAVASSYHMQVNSGNLPWMHARTSHPSDGSLLYKHVSFRNRQFRGKENKVGLLRVSWNAAQFWDLCVLCALSQY